MQHLNLLGTVCSIHCDHIRLWKNNRIYHFLCLFARTCEPAEIYPSPHMLNLVSFCFSSWLWLWRCSPAFASASTGSSASVSWPCTPCSWCIASSKNSYAITTADLLRQITFCRILMGLLRETDLSINAKHFGGDILNEKWIAWKKRLSKFWDDFLVDKVCK